MSNHNKKIDEEWFKTVYQGDKMPQLTVRAVIMGSILGAFMSLSNLYVGLKTGWGLGVAITSCILSYGIWKTLRLAFPRLFTSDMSILENNCMQSTASSAGYSTGGTMVSAISAYLLVTNAHIPASTLYLWTFCLAAFGVFIAVPMKRQMINHEKLKFPSGIAAAETLRSLHSSGAEANQKAKSLGIAALLGGLITWIRDVPNKVFNLPASLPIPGSIMGYPFERFTISVEMSTVMIAAGAIVGWKLAWSMLLGGTINFAFLAPAMIEAGGINPEKLGYREIVAWSTWAGSAMMVTSGLLYFAFQWSTVASAMKQSLASLFGREEKDTSEMSKIEVPTSWFLIGTSLSALACVAILHVYFETGIAMGLLAIVLTFFLALVACRATGESDITPIGAMGKITQLTYGVIAPGKVVTNLMTACLTAGAATSAADLLTDLKSGYLLGANPKKQFIAQFLGIFAGTLAVVPAFYLIVPDASVLGTDKWPAPSAQVWAAVAKLLATGVSALHSTKVSGMIAGALIGIALPLFERSFPKYEKYIPSATGLGLSLVIPFFNSLSMFIGASIAMIIEKYRPIMASKYIVPVSSGFIAGESLIGVAVALLSTTGVI
jgi:putative OPT family oligopeptide transporter